MPKKRRGQSKGSQNRKDVRNTTTDVAENSLFSLPAEFLTAVADMLPISALGSLACCSHLAKQVADDDVVWKRRCLAAFPSLAGSDGGRRMHDAADAHSYLHWKQAYRQQQLKGHGDQAGGLRLDLLRSQQRPASVRCDDIPPGAIALLPPHVAKCGKRRERLPYIRSQELECVDQLLPYQVLSSTASQVDAVAIAPQAELVSWAWNDERLAACGCPMPGLQGEVIELPETTLRKMEVAIVDDDTVDLYDDAADEGMRLQVPVLSRTLLGLIRQQMEGSEEPVYVRVLLIAGKPDSTLVVHWDPR